MKRSELRKAKGEVDMKKSELKELIKECYRELNESEFGIIIRLFGKPVNFNSFDDLDYELVGRKIDGEIEMKEKEFEVRVRKPADKKKVLAVAKQLGWKAK